MKNFCINCHSRKCYHHGKHNPHIDDKRNVCDSHTTEEMREKLDEIERRTNRLSPFMKPSKIPFVGGV